MLNNQILSNITFGMIIDVLIIMLIYVSCISIICKNCLLLKKCNSSAKGEILELIPHSTPKGTWYAIRVQFTADGKTVTVIDGYGNYAPWRTKQGDTVDVLYDPLNPQKNYIIGEKRSRSEMNGIFVVILVVVTFVIVHSIVR